MNNASNLHCVGPQSPQAGIAPSCQGCPNARFCASAPKGPDVDLPLIQQRLKHIRHKVMVISGKGGVGKSTVAKQLAFALGARGFQVGLLDLDICGPSLPRLTGVRAEDAHQSAGGIQPVLIDDNVTMMSMHYFLQDKNEAVLFRGARKNGVIKLFFKDVIWGQLDVLLIDTPPGTSDEHITTCNLLQQTRNGVDGAILVTTPQRVAEADVKRQIGFCNKAKLPILGIVQNMSGFICPHCHTQSIIFPSDDDRCSNVSSNVTSDIVVKNQNIGAGARLGAEFNIPLWARIPLDPQLMQSCEDGVSLSQLLRETKSQLEESESAKEANVYTSSKTITAIMQVADALIKTLKLDAEDKCNNNNNNNSDITD